MRKAKAIFILLLFVKLLSSQNLVQNPSFEDYINCPYDYTHVKDSVKELTPFWFVNDASTPDYFNTCCKNNISSVPNNFAGNLDAYKGNAYAGIILRVNPYMYPGSASYKEHLQGMLSEPLIRNQLYCCGFSVAMAPSSGLAVDAIGIILTKEKQVVNYNNKQYNSPNIQNTKGKIIAGDDGWVKIQGVYRARGGERYITIGNFLSLEETFVYEIKQKKEKAIDQYAYYYIDEVFVYPIQELNSCQPSVENHVRDSFPIIKEERTSVDSIFQEEFFVSPKQGDVFILHNVFFDFDKSILLEESREQLDRIYDLMLEFSEMEIMIYGHTDNIGAESYNMLLSEQRAKAVFEYLYFKGIPLFRMNYMGMGSNKPIADNNIAEGREKNRRVEIKIVDL